VLGCSARDAKFCVCAFAGAVSRLPLAYMHSGIHGVNSHIFVFTNSARDAMFGVRAFRECSLSSLTLAYVQSSIARCGDIYIFVFVCSARGAMIGVCDVREFTFKFDIVICAVEHCAMWWRTSGWRLPGIYLFLCRYLCVWDCASLFSWGYLGMSRAMGRSGWCMRMAGLERMSF